MSTRLTASRTCTQAAVTGKSWTQAAATGKSWAVENCVNGMFMLGGG